MPVTVHGKEKQKAAIPSNVHDALYARAMSFDARLRYIDNLSTTLPPADVALLLDYLKNVDPDDGLDPAPHRRAFVNDVIFALRSQQNPPLELTATLAGIYADKTRDPGLRDYAIQHISEWRWRAIQRDPAAARKIDDTLWAAAQETGQPLSGTALLALNRLVADTKMPDHDTYAADYQKRLTQTAKAIASNQSAPVAARITALGVSGTSPDNAALISGILNGPTEPPMLQLAAMGALAKNIPQGTPLEPATRALIETAAHSPYPPLQKLAAKTLRNHTF